jgi:hypothetical protein
MLYPQTADADNGHRIRDYYLTCSRLECAAMTVIAAGHVDNDVPADVGAIARAVLARREADRGLNVAGLLVDTDDSRRQWLVTVTLRDGDQCSLAAPYLDPQ